MFGICRPQPAVGRFLNARRETRLCQLIIEEVKRVPTRGGSALFSQQSAPLGTALCMLFGVGLILFELNTENPNFQIRMRAQRFSPDMFYVNEFADRLRLHNPELFEELFG